MTPWYCFLPARRKGNICMIPNCKEFFIATADHPEWGHSHTIWGEVSRAANSSRATLLR